MAKQETWVIKAGSSLVSGRDQGINKKFINQLAYQIDFLIKEKQQVVIIASGAVARGMS